MKIEFNLPENNMTPGNEDLEIYDLNSSPFIDNDNFTYIGKLPHPKSSDIKTSMIGIGYETLDRDSYDPKITYDFMADSGVKWARVQTGWLKCEKEKGKYDFTWLDELVDSLLAIGIQPWFSLSFGNPLYTPVPEYSEWICNHKDELPPHHIRGYVGEVPLYHGDEAVKGWRNYVKAICSHFKNRVSHWEVWNEPNVLGSFWRQKGGMPYPDLDERERTFRCAADYTALTRISAEEVHSVIPNAKIIGGSISNGINANGYIIGLQKNSFAEIVDIVTFHPYSLMPEDALKCRYDFIYHNLKRRDGSTPAIWQGEAGRPEGETPEYVKVPTEYNQAKHLTRRFLCDFNIGCEMSSWFTVCDFKGYKKGLEFGYGVINRRKKSPKLSFSALQSIGWLFAEAIPSPELYIRPYFYAFDSWNHRGVVTTQFRRQGSPVFGFYHPETPDLSFQPRTMDELLLYVNENDTFDNPVIIDPIRRHVFKINNHFIGAAWGGCMVFKKMPYVDYPYFIMDASCFEN